MPRKQNNTGLAIGLVLVVIVGSFFATSGFTKNPFTGGPLSGVSYANPTPALAGAGAYCPGTSTSYSVPFSNLPSNCINVPETLQITPQAWDPGINGCASGPQTGCTFKASANVVCKIFQLQPSGWVNTETDLGSSSGVCTSTQTYFPGSQIIVEFCERTSAVCDISSSTYTTTSTVMYCPLPSTLPSGVCGTGPGSGYVPLWTPSGSTTIQYSYNMPVLASSGDQYQGMNAANKQSLAWTWQNGTQVTTTAAVCFVGRSADCASPTASSQGRFAATITVQPFGTFPAAPYAFGYASFSQTDPSYQQGTAARGPLNYVIVVEVKATTNNDMCTITNGGTVTFSGGQGAFTVTPTIIARGGSATDSLYIYTIPDWAAIRATDGSGNPVTGYTGLYTGNFGFDCSQVYSAGPTGGTDVVGIAATQWQYFSTKYVQAYVGNAINPEAVKVGGAADAAAAFGTVSNGLQIKNA